MDLKRGRNEDTIVRFINRNTSWPISITDSRRVSYCRISSTSNLTSVIAILLDDLTSQDLKLGQREENVMRLDSIQTYGRVIMLDFEESKLFCIFKLPRSPTFCLHSMIRFR